MKPGRLVAAAAFVLSNGLFGALAGAGTYRLLQRQAVGWDALAAGLGAMMLGGLVGLVLAALLSPRRSTRVYWTGTAVALALAMTTFAALRAGRESPTPLPQPRRQPTSPKPTQPGPGSGAAVSPHFWR